MARSAAGPRAVVPDSVNLPTRGKGNVTIISRKAKTADFSSVTALSPTPELVSVSSPWSVTVEADWGNSRQPFSDS